MVGQRADDWTRLGAVLQDIEQEASGKRYETYPLCYAPHQLIG